MKKRILCFGDSNTWGYRAKDGLRFPEDVRWTGRLAGLLGEDYAVIEEGLNGRTALFEDRIENKMAGIDYLTPCMDTCSPFELIIIMLGTNDAKTYFSLGAANIADGVKRLARLALASDFGPGGAAPKALIIAPPLIDDTPAFSQAFGKQAAEKSKRFAGYYKAAAKELGCAFMDASKVTPPDPIDGVHITAEGHAALAQAVYEQVKAIIG